jgi:hypothetical protein
MAGYLKISFIRVCHTRRVVQAELLEELCKVIDAVRSSDVAPRPCSLVAILQSY